MPLESWSENVVVVHLGDDPQFTDDMEALEQQLNQRPVHAVLDFASVHYINSSNIARLLKVRKLMAAQECRLLLCSISTQVWSVFLVTGLDKIFEMTDAVPTALASLQLARSRSPGETRASDAAD